MVNYSDEEGVNRIVVSTKNYALDVNSPQVDVYRYEIGVNSSELS